jgi:hypothetical protein|tara:strand:+ start:19 stop:288 length:270 start_codon:yes stop_codon:yes gene_type:complete
LPVFHLWFSISGCAEYVVFELGLAAVKVLNGEKNRKKEEAVQEAKTTYPPPYPSVSRCIYTYIITSNGSANKSVYKPEYKHFGKNLSYK